MWRYTVLQQQQYQLLQYVFVDLSNSILFADNILLQPLEHVIGINNTALQWFESYPSYNSSLFM